jgi:hypothetical protein
MDFGEIGWVGTDWINPAHNKDWWLALVNIVMYLQVP